MEGALVRKYFIVGYGIGFSVQGSLFTGLPREIQFIGLYF